MFSEMCDPVETNSLQFLTEELRRLASNVDFGVKPILDDAFLARFIRVRNGDIEKALDSLKAYYRNAFLHQDFNGIRPLQYSQAFLSSIIIPLKGRTDGRRVLAIRTDLWDPSIISLRALQVSAFFQAEYASQEILTQQNGLILIFELSGLSLRHAKQLTLREIIRTINAMQNGLPLKISQIHCVNPPRLLQPLMILASTFLNMKIRNRTNFHRSFSTLSQHIDQSILPNCLGGVLEDGNAFDINFIERILEDNFLTDQFWRSNSDGAHTNKQSNLESDVKEVR